jgi:L-iditol 2-dehydrogenase
MMQAAILYAPNDLRIEERPMLEISPEEMRIRVAACAICGSDVRTFRFGAGNITEPVTMGHETAGVIVDVGAAVAGFSAGQRVTVAPAVPCGECPYCRRGIQTMCDNLRSIGYQFHGGFAEYMVVPSSAIKAGCVNVIPDDLSFEEATLAEPLACVINGQELLNVDVADTVAILGAGPVGCMHANLAKIRGARQVILADIQPRRLELAQGFGADVLIDSKKEALRERVLQETEGAGASVVIVAAPSGAAQEESLTLAAKHGRVSFFGGLPKSNPFISFNSNLVHYKELFVMGAYGSAPRHNVAALELLAAGKIHAKNLIGLLVPLERIQEGMEAVAEGRVLKAIVRPGSKGNRRHGSNNGHRNSNYPQPQRLPRQTRRIVRANSQPVPLHHQGRKRETNGGWQEHPESDAAGSNARHRDYHRGTGRRRS